jgi:hypothetical protein
LATPALFAKNVFAFNANLYRPQTLNPWVVLGPIWKYTLGSISGQSKTA